MVSSVVCWTPACEVDAMKDLRFEGGFLVEPAGMRAARQMVADPDRLLGRTFRTAPGVFRVTAIDVDADTIELTGIAEGAKPVMMPTREFATLLSVMTEC